MRTRLRRWRLAALRTRETPGWLDAPVPFDNPDREHASSPARRRPG